MLLREKAIEPTREVLENALGEDCFNIYEEVMKILTSEMNLACEWRYYEDVKAWLCKVTLKKKTLFWLSIWEGFIRTTFYFTEKTRIKIEDLPISKEIKEHLKLVPPGKLIPLILDLQRQEQLNDFREIVGYKKNLR